MIAPSAEPIPSRLGNMVLGAELFAGLTAVDGVRGAGKIRMEFGHVADPMKTAAPMTLGAFRPRLCR